MEVSSSTIVDLFGSNQFVSWPRARSPFQRVCPGPFPSCFTNMYKTTLQNNQRVKTTQAYQREWSVVLHGILLGNKKGKVPATHGWTFKTGKVKEADTKAHAWFRLYEMSTRDISIEAESRLMVAWGRGLGRADNYAQGVRCVFMTWHKCSELMECVPLREYPKCHWTAHFKWVICICKLYLNKAVRNNNISQTVPGTPAWSKHNF